MSFSINFEPPENGWLPIHIKSNSQTLDLSASDHPECSVTYLINTLCAYLEGHKAVRCHWYLEPKVLEFVFVRLATETMFAVCSKRTPPFNSATKFHENPAVKIAEESLFYIQGSTFEIISEFCRSLDELSVAIPLEEWGELHRWSWPFPVEELVRMNLLMSNNP